MLMNSFDGLSKLLYSDVFVSSALKKINNMLGELQTFLMVSENYNLYQCKTVSITYAY